jgi:hypothetical protein
MPDFGIFRGFSENSFGDKLYAGQLPKQLGAVGSNSLDFLLDIYPNAAAAYSLRKLRIAYTGNAIRVRRASDNTEQNIGFDSNNELDTVSLASFCSGTNGFVTTWYDQSGNGRDATQSTGANQPQIVSSGSVILDNGKPTIKFDGNSDFLNLSNYANLFNNVGYADIFNVSKFSTSTALMTLFFASTGGNANNRGRIIFGVFQDNKLYTGGRRLDTDIGYTQLSTGTISDNTQYLQSSIISYADSDLRQYVNGILDGENLNFQTDGNTDATNSKNSNGLDITIGSLGTANYYNGFLQEMIIYTSDQSSNRTGIETNINDFYSIY